MCTERQPGRWRPAARTRAQRGSLLLELMVVAAIALVVALWATHEWAERTRTLQARSLAVWMQTARDALQAYLDLGDVPSDGLPPPGETEPPADLPGIVERDRIPDWDVLKGLGLLPAGWLPRGPLGHTLGITVWPTGDCPRDSCRRQALVHTQRGLSRRDGTVDDALIAEWLLAAAGHGLVIWPRAPDHLSGAGRQISLQDTGLRGRPPGVVALLASQTRASGVPGSGGAVLGDMEDFLRMYDARDPAFQGNLSAQGVVRSDTRVAARESLVLEKGWGVGAPCAPEGALGREQAYPGLLVCHQRIWQPAARAAGGGYMMSTRRGCQSALGVSTVNPYTGSCSCAPGFGPLQVSESGSAMAPEGLTTGYVCVPR